MTCYDYQISNKTRLEAYKTRFGSGCLERKFDYLSMTCMELESMLALGKIIL